MFEGEGISLAVDKGPQGRCCSVGALALDMGGIIRARADLSPLDGNVACRCQRSFWAIGVRFDPSANGAKAACGGDGWRQFGQLSDRVALVIEIQQSARIVASDCVVQTWLSGGRDWRGRG